MLGVSCRDRDMAMPVRWVRLRRSASVVCAWTLRYCALERKRMAFVTALLEFARNPTISRLACGPISVGCDRIGFHSTAATAAVTQQRAISPAITDFGSGIPAFFMDGKPSN